MAKAKRKKRQMIDHESTVEGLVIDAFAELTSLGEEMREAYDNTPENLQQSGVGEARGEAADALENLNEPDVPECVKDLPIKWQELEKRGHQSRSARRDDCLLLLNNVVDRVQEYLDQKDVSEDDRSSADQFLSEVEDLISDAEAVEFPGMFG